MTLIKAKQKAQNCQAQTGQTFFVVYDNSLGDSSLESYYACNGFDLDTFFNGLKPIYCSESY